MDVKGPETDTRGPQASLTPLLPVGAWALAAAALAASGVIDRAPRGAVPGVVLVPVTAFLAALSASASFRAALGRLDLRWLVAFHVLRAPIGAAVLALAARDALPRGFALAAGWGHLIVGLLAIGAARAARVRTRESRRLVTAWNVLGLAHAVAVLIAATWLLLGVREPRLEGMLHFPGTLVLALVVPLVLMTHLTIMERHVASHLAAKRRAADVARA